MGRAAATHLRDLESAYSQLVLDTLPVLKYPDLSAADWRDAEPTLLVVGPDDNLDACIRTIPRTRDAKGSRVSRQLQTISSEVVAELDSKGSISLDSAGGLLTSLSAGIKELRQRIESIGGMPHVIDAKADFALEVQHPVEGSLFLDLIAPRVRFPQADHRYLSIDSYLAKTRFDAADAKTRTGAFHALLCEAANATMHQKWVNEQILAGISAVVLPFSALGVLRGAAVWFCCGEYHRQQIATNLDEACRTTGLEGALGDLYSAAVIDVFEAFLLSRLEQSTLPSAGGSGSVPRGPFRYLFPCSNAVFIEEGVSDRADSATEITISLSDPDVRRYLGASGIRWDLLYPVATCDLSTSPKKAESRRTAFQQLIEAKLRHIPMSASRIAGNEVSAGVYRLGHQFSRRVKPFVMRLNSLDRRLHQSERSIDQLGDDTVLIEAVSGAHAALDRIEKLGQLMDLVADALLGCEGVGTISHQSEWQEDEPYPLSQKVEELAVWPRDPSVCAPLRVDTSKLNTASTVCVNCWVPTQHSAKPGKIRPCDVLYDESIQEVLSNAAAHGAVDEGYVSVEVNLEPVRHASATRPLDCVVFRNGLPQDETSASLETTAERLCIPALSQWFRCGESGDRPRGGLHFVDLALAVTGAGQLLVRVDSEPPTLSVALQLEGLAAREMNG